MSEIYSKYKNSLKAATLLLNSDFHDTVCHAAYYACLQLMKDTLDANGTSLEEQEKIIKSQYKNNSHAYCIDETKKILTPKLSTVRNGLDVFNEIKQLKRKRIIADYNARKISKIESKWCLDKAKEITQLILSVR